MNHILKLRILDIAKRTNVVHWYKFFLSTLKWDRNNVIAYQNDRLNKLIHYSYNNIPYYRKIMTDRNILPKHIKTVEDLTRFPTLDRDIIRSEQQNLLPKSFNKLRLHKGSSSGTTGIPIQYYHDNNGISAEIASCYVLWFLSNWRPGQKNVHIWGNVTSIKRWNTWSSKAKNFWMNQLNIPSIFIDDSEKIDSIAKKIMKFQPQSLEGYSGSIYTLAKYFLSHNYSII